MTILQDVAFDPATARQAIGQLERTARRLDDLTRAREALADHARSGWHGARREDFDERLVAIAGRSEELAHELRLAAAHIEADLEASAAEQRRRERLRADLDPPLLAGVG